MRAELEEEEKEAPDRYPIRGTFASCWAWADTQNEKSRAPRVGTLIFLIVLCLLPSLVPRHLTLARSHLITLSARNSIDCGISSPICFAVLRLILRSNFIGASTGKSAGLAPFRILST